MTTHHPARTADIAVMLVAVSVLGTPAARKPGIDQKSPQSLLASGAGSEVSLSDFLQHGFIKTQVSDQLLKPGVFHFEIFELAGLVGFQATVLFPPAVVDLLGGMSFPGHDCLPSKYVHSMRLLA